MKLQVFLDDLHRRYHQSEFLNSDPLEFAHHYDDPWDQEAVALLGAVLAYGNVKQIRRSIEDALDRMHRIAPKGPAAFVRSLSTPAGRVRARKGLSGFIHRFNRGEDVFMLFRLLEKSWVGHGSMGAHFLSHLRPDDPHIESALNALIEEWKAWAEEFWQDEETKSESFAYFLTAPKDGSCCKRWCMFLRWMGRKDSLDLGLWTRKSGLAKTFKGHPGLQPRQLIIPLDTHTGRISQYLGLTDRKSLNWLAAVEVTDSLRACDPADPTRYDFAISRLGILDLCQKKYREEICRKCELLKVCRLAKMKGKSA